MGLLTPVTTRPAADLGIQQIEKAFHEVKTQPHDFLLLKKLHVANRELHSPVIRVSYSLSPWIAFFIMPLFALANAGVNITQINLDYSGAYNVVLGISIALVLGKPLGIFCITWLSVRMGIGSFSSTFNYKWLLLVSWRVLVLPWQSLPQP